MAEDDADLRDAIVLVLAEQGYNVQTARDGLEATRMVPTFGPDLVILDMRMPRVSGSNACAAIRKTSDIPIIMFTSSDDAAEVRDAILKGATDFVLKSTGVSILTERVRFHLAKPNPFARVTVAENVESKKPDTASASKLSSGSGGNRAVTMSLIVSSDKNNRDVIKAVLTRLNQDFVEVETAAEAITVFKQQRLDILITDWKMPDMDAFRMLSEMARARNTRNSKNAKNIYKFIVSDRLSPEAHRKARFAGITEFLSKPLDSLKVEKAVADCVRQSLRKRNRRSRSAA